MSVYVDDLLPREEWMVCHMVADTTDELHEMAGKIGLASGYRIAIRYPCYNLTEEERAEAIKHGAIEVDTRKVVDVLNAMRPKDGEPDPWSELDGAARANLEGSVLAEFWRYKQQLRDEGHAWEDDAEVILRGFIWDSSEEGEA